MLIRIVKMDFQTSKTTEFLKIFKAHKLKIREFAGCQFLELYQDKNNPSIFFTYSYWENEEVLENYRKSDLFIQVWSKTKQLFQNKPQAWSVNKIASLK